MQDGGGRGFTPAPVIVMTSRPSFLARVLGLLRPASARPGHGLDELSRRLGIPLQTLQSTPILYRQFTMPKRTGGVRTISVPDPALMTVQRAILRRLLSRLHAHPAAHGFERGRSIATHAALHARRAVVVRLDIQDFFGRTAAKRVNAYFRAIGWNSEAAELLTRLCTHTVDGTKRIGLPQGAPTSPRLSNLVNHRMDKRLSALARRSGGVYSRYADDLSFSFDDSAKHNAGRIIWPTGGVLEEFGYRLHTRKKRRIMRSSQRQTVTGLVVNDGVRLTRERRKWLRAVEHRVAKGDRRPTITLAQLRGWQAFKSMIDAHTQD